MTEKQGEEWSAYWSGRAHHERGSVFGAVGIERDEELAAFWTGKLEALKDKRSLLDIACGAGSVVRQVQGVGFEFVCGFDISPEAIKMMQQAYSGTYGAVGSAHQMPFASDSLQVLTSQFGIEYAGLNASITDIARILEPGGLFLAVIHMEDGDIYRECAEKRRWTEAFSETNFANLAGRVFDAAFALDKAGPNADQSLYQNAIAEMAPARDAMAELGAKGYQLAEQAIDGVQTLFARRAAYLPQDITQWLGKLTEENTAYHARMAGMMTAAVSREEAEAACTALKEAGLRTEALQALNLGERNDQLAWVIEARKPA